MHKKLQEMWDAAHEIPEGSYVTEDTVLVQLDQEEHELHFYAANVSALWVGSPKYAPVRSVDPLPDPEDTGTLYVDTDVPYDGVLLVDNSYDKMYSLTKAQAQNLARKITEAI